MLCIVMAFCHHCDNDVMIHMYVSLLNVLIVLCSVVKFYHKNSYCGSIKVIALYCIVLYCIVLHCIVLYCIALYCIVLYCTNQTETYFWTALEATLKAVSLPPIFSC